ncbi:MULTISPECIES: glycoside hydrolase family 113 [Paenibacillus]|uniref:glycoside hydrolase family 113 n=1 Tax=Paenibacillus TaxID=44249 RepID=UPI0006769315|nr:MULTISPECIES: hypothetical protein [Paenibacillus]
MFPIGRLVKMLLAAGLAAAAFAAAVWMWTSSQPKEKTDFLSLKVKSANLSVDYDPEQVLEDAGRLGLNTVNVPVVVEVSDVRSSDMTLDEASLNKAIELIPRLQSRGMRIIVEPYPWINRGSEVETDWNPDHLDAFFEQWRSRVLVPLARRVAEPYHADAMIAGSNLVHLERFGGEWSSMLQQLRGEYSGLLTYKTNWWYTAAWDKASTAAYEAKRDNPLWADTDFITVAAYFELSERRVNTAGQLLSALSSTEVNGRGQDVVSEVMALSGKWGKPVYFGELGFPAREYAAKEPWNPSPSDVEDGGEQARLFQAYREAFSGKPGFMGFSVFAIGEKSKDKHYYPSDDSAKVIRAW